MVLHAFKGSKVISFHSVIRFHCKQTYHKLKRGYYNNNNKKTVQTQRGIEYIFRFFIFTHKKKLEENTKVLIRYRM